MNKEDILKSALVWGNRAKGSSTPILRTLQDMEVDVNELKYFFNKYKELLKFGIALVGTEKHLTGTIQVQEPSIAYLMGSLALDEFVDTFLSECGNETVETIDTE